MKFLYFILCALTALPLSAAEGEPVKAKCDPYLTEYGGYGYLIEDTPKAAVWWAEGVYKVMRDTPVPKTRSRGIKVSSARNESESFIIVVNPKTGLEDVKVEIAPWKGGSGEPVGEKVRKVEYVPVTLPTDDYGWKGDWPDPLPVYDTPETFSPGSNHSFWITLKVPEGKPAGTYTSSIILSDRNGWKVEMPISLKVRDFSLPKSPAVRSGFGMSMGYVHQYDNLTTEEQKAEAYEYYMKSLSDHRITPYNPMERHPVKQEIYGVKWSGGKFDSSDKVEGNYSFVVEDASYHGFSEAVYKQGLIPVSQGKPYKLTFFARSEKDGHTNVTVELYDKDGNQLPFDNSFLEFKTKPEWKEYSLDVGTDNPSAAYCKIRLFGALNVGGGESTGKTWFDDVRLVNIETGKNEFPDGNFEPDLDEIGVSLDFEDYAKAASHYFGDLGFNACVLGLAGLGGGTYYSRIAGSFAGFPEGSPEYEKLMGQYLTQIGQGLKQYGILDKGYVYWFDEPGSKEDYDFIKGTHTMLKKLAPGIRTFITEGRSEHDISDVTDISCTIWGSLDHDKIAKMNSRPGNEVWSYLCTGPKSPWINLFIDNDAINMRLWLWVSYMYRLKGILVWNAVYWNSPEASPAGLLQDPWQYPMSYETSYGIADGKQAPWGNGDGRFFYPLNRHPNEDRETVYLGEPVPSLRLEILRDGIDDYDYLTLLAEAVGKAGNSRSALVREAKSLLALPKDYYTDDTHFSKDPRFLLERRERIAELIEKLSK